NTIKRTKSGYNDTSIHGEIETTIVIRESILNTKEIPKSTMPHSTYTQLMEYEQKTNQLHNWEVYFPFLQYRVLTMSLDELSEIHHMDEGLEYRMKETALHAQSLADDIEKLKSKRNT